MQTRLLLYLVPIFWGLSISFNAFSKTVFVVDSYHAEYPWTAHCRRGLLENLDPSFDIHLFEMNTKRIDPSMFANRADQAWQKLQTTKPDLVITLDDNALSLLGERVTNAGIPLVFMGINNNPRAYFNKGEIPKNASGVLERPILSANVRLINQLVETKVQRILIMMDSGTTSQAFANSTMKGKKSIHVEGAVLELWMGKNYQDWQTKVNSLSKQEYDVLIIGSFANLRTAHNKPVSDIETTEWTSKNSAIPMFTFWGQDVGKNKAIGGVVISGYDQGKKAAEAANSILLNQQFPFLEAPRHGDLLFSKTELDRWKMVIPTHLQKRAQLVE